MLSIFKRQTKYDRILRAILLQVEITQNTHKWNRDCSYVTIFILKILEEMS